VSLFLASASRSAVNGTTLMTTTQNIACGLDSWHASSSSQSIKQPDKEILKLLLEGKVLVDSPSRYFNPICLSLGKIDWAIFGCLTFQRDFLTYDTKDSEALRQTEFRRLLTGACAKHNVRPRNLLFYIKTERGVSDRGHFHFLIGKERIETVSPEGFSKTMRELWTSGAYRRGTAKIESFQEDLKLDGILYQSKYEYDEMSNQRILNESCSLALKKKLWPGQRHEYPYTFLIQNTVFNRGKPLHFQRNALSVRNRI
jgi:hypothetical protein